MGALVGAELLDDPLPVRSGDERHAPGDAGSKLVALEDGSDLELQGGLVVAVLAVLVYDGLAALERRLAVRTGRAG